MAIQRWDPIRDMMQLQQRMNRMFEDAFSRAGGPDDVESLPSGAWRPPIDLFEAGDRYVLRVDLPGTPPGDVEIQAEEGTLTVRGERKADPAVGREAFYRMERPTGPFALQIALPPSVDPPAITAAHRDGVLEILLPKKKEAGPGRIRVQVG